MNKKNNLALLLNKARLFDDNPGLLNLTKGTVPIVRLLSDNSR